MNAADKEGRGDVRGKQAAGLLIVRDKAGYGGYTDRMVDIRIDEHPEPIKELNRVFKIYDMIFLTRDDPGNLLKIEGEIASDIKSVLNELGYIKKLEMSSIEKWDKADSLALEAWIGINNFENKWRDDGKIWRSIYDYIRKEKGTPMVSLRKMSEF